MNLFKKKLTFLSLLAVQRECSSLFQGTAASKVELTTAHS